MRPWVGPSKSQLFVRPRQLSFGAKGCQFMTFLKVLNQLRVSLNCAVNQKLDWAVNRKLGSEPET